MYFFITIKILWAFIHFNEHILFYVNVIFIRMGITSTTEYMLHIACRVFFNRSSTEVL